MRRIAVINQKGGVGKTTTCANLGAALARLGHRTLVVDMDPQANLSMHLGQELFSEDASSYTVLTGETPFEAAIRPTSTPGLSIVPAHIDLSGAELELASAIGRETLLRDAIDDWERAALARTDATPVDYLILDCPPSLGLLSVNALAAAREVLIAVQTEFFALQGMSKLVEVVQLLRRRLNPELRIRGILPCLYDSRLRLAREVLAEVRRYFPGQVFQTSVRTNVKLAEAPSHGVTIFEYDPQCTGATDHLALAQELLAQEGGEGTPPVESGPQRAAELERRLNDMARGSRPGEPSPAEPGPAAPEAAEPEATRPDPVKERVEGTDGPEVHAVTFPVVAATEPRAVVEPEPGPIAREAIVLEPRPSAGAPPGRDDLIVLSEPTEAATPPLDPPKQEERVRADPAGAQLPPKPPTAASSPSRVTLKPISWQPHSPEPDAPGSEEPPAEDLAAHASEALPEETLTPLAAEEAAPLAPERAGEEPLEEVDVPRPADQPTPSRWNFSTGYGEDRARMAGKLGPRTP